jgi:hypothetical protein
MATVRLQLNLARMRFFWILFSIHCLARRAALIELAMANDLVYMANLHLGASPQNKRGNYFTKSTKTNGKPQHSAASRFQLNLRSDRPWHTTGTPALAVEGGGFTALRCTLRAAYTASLLDTAEFRSLLPGSPAGSAGATREAAAAASLVAPALIAPALPAYATYPQSFGLADAPDLQPATLLTRLGRTQSTISWAVNKIRGERFWPSPTTAGSRG